jgi:hypothetical protein
MGNVLLRECGLAHIGGVGMSSAKLLLDNPRLPALQPLEIDALADTGAIFFAFPIMWRTSSSSVKAPRRK